MRGSRRGSGLEVELSVAQRGYLLVGQVLVPAVINLVLNGAIGFAMFRGRQHGAAPWQREHRRRHGRHVLLPAGDHLPDRDADRARARPEGRGASL